jgi:Flp pilus assembly protein TadG
MQTNRVFLKRLQNLGVDQSGAIATYAAIGILVFLGFGALTVDIGHMVSVKGELQKAADAGALAGARGLWPQDLATSTTRVPDGTAAESKASYTAKQNQVERVNLTNEEVTAQVGRWDYAAKQFIPGNSSSANGVKVTTRRANVQMVLAQALGLVPRNMSASAVAIMDFAACVGKGSLPIAVNLDNALVPGDDIYIGFNPDPEDNGGWFAVAPDSASASTFKDYIQNDSCPELKVGDPLSLENGVDTTALQVLKAELATRTDDWLVFLPVVDTPKFNHTDQVDSFVCVKLVDIKDTGTPKYVHGVIKYTGLMEQALPGPGKTGVPSTGALAPPKLVN